MPAKNRRKTARRRAALEEEAGEASRSRRPLRSRDAIVASDERWNSARPGRPAPAAAGVENCVPRTLTLTSVR
jgi:hypothetical protein